MKTAWYNEGQRKREDDTARWHRAVSLDEPGDFGEGGDGGRNRVGQEHLPSTCCVPGVVRNPAVSLLL